MKRKDDGVDVQGKQPCFYFYPADFERDVSPLPMVAQALWIRMLCKMHWAKRRGYLEHSTGAAITPEELARMVGQPIKTVNAALSDMERIGIFSRDDSGTIFCRRMVRDTEISRVRRDAAAKRLLDAERDFAGQFAPAKHPPNGQQKPVPSSSLSPSPSPSGKTTTTAAPPFDLAEYPKTLETIRFFHPDTDDRMCRELIGMVNGVEPGVPDAEIARGLCATKKPKQYSAALWRDTLPEWIKNTTKQRETQARPQPKCSACGDSGVRGAESATVAEVRDAIAAGLICSCNAGQRAREMVQGMEAA